MHYDHKRQIWMQQIQTAYKDNPAVKKGMSYIRVKKTQFSAVEYFENEDYLNEVYPIPSFQVRHRSEIKLLNQFKRELVDNKNLTATKFLKSQGYD